MQHKMYWSILLSSIRALILSCRAGSLAAAVLLRNCHSNTSAIGTNSQICGRIVNAHYATFYYITLSLVYLFGHKERFLVLQRARVFKYYFETYFSNNKYVKPYKFKEQMLVYHKFKDKKLWAIPKYNSNNS